VNALWNLIFGIRALLRWLGLLPFPPLKAVVKAIRTALSRLLRVLRPVKRLINQLTPQLRALKAQLKAIRSVIKAIVRRMRSIRIKLFLAESLARALEPQQDFLERILPPDILARLRRLLAQLDTLTQALTTARIALIAILAALDIVIAALRALTRQVDALMQRIKNIMSALTPLQAALQAIQAGIQKLMQNPIIKAILNGVAWLMDQADRLINALLDRLGITALLDRLLQRLTGLGGILQALQLLSAKLGELAAKLTEIRAQLDAIADLLKEIESVLDDLINILQTIQLPTKYLLEAALPEYAYLVRRVHEPALTEPIEFEATAIAADASFLEEIDDLDAEVERLSTLIDLLEDESHLELPPGILQAVVDQPSSETEDPAIPGLVTGEQMVAELDEALAGSTEELAAVLEQLEVPMLDADGRRGLKGMFDHFARRSDSPTDEEE
jgi:DNA repair exonuclease SbcCD ATPase subunit